LSETCGVSFQNKSDHLVYLFVFIIRICHDAQSCERKKLRFLFQFEFYALGLASVPTDKNLETEVGRKWGPWLGN